MGKWTKLRATHVCSVCGHKWVKSPYVLYSPLAALGCSLDNNGKLTIVVLPSLHIAQGECGVTIGTAAAWNLPGNYAKPAAECLCIAQSGQELGVSVAESSCKVSKHVD